MRCVKPHDIGWLLTSTCPRYLCYSLLPAIRMPPYAHSSQSELLTLACTFFSASIHSSSHCAYAPPSASAGGAPAPSNSSHSSTSARANCTRLIGRHLVKSCAVSEVARCGWVSSPKWYVRRLAASWREMRKWLTRIPIVLQKG